MLQDFFFELGRIELVFQETVDNEDGDPMPKKVGKGTPKTREEVVEALETLTRPLDEKEKERLEKELRTLHARTTFAKVRRLRLVSPMAERAARSAPSCLCFPSRPLESCPPALPSAEPLLGALPLT